MTFAEPVEVVGVDGDDTLWRCQDAFDEAEVEVARLLAPYADEAQEGFAESAQVDFRPDPNGGIATVRLCLTDL